MSQHLDTNTSILSASCPMPKLDFDIITLGHGSGGLLTNQLLDSGVFELLSNEFLNKRHDGAILPISGPLAFSTDSYVVTPLEFPGGNIGDLAVHGTINDLSMCGALPKYLSLSFILEEGLSVSTFWKILVSIREAAIKSGIHIVTGDTKVVEKGKGDLIYINTSGIGTLHPHAQIDRQRIQTGDKIIVSSSIANHGMAIMSQREGLEFESAIQSDTRPLHQLTKALLDQLGKEVHALTDPTRGGIASVLNEIAHQVKCGIELLQSNIPVEEAVSSACELLGLDPLYVANEGVLIAFVPSAHADTALEIMQQFPGGTHARIIGEIVEQHPGQVLLKSAIGGMRVVNMLVGEQLPRIC